LCIQLIFILQKAMMNQVKLAFVAHFMAALLLVSVTYGLFNQQKRSMPVVPIFKLFYDYPSSHSLYITAAKNVTNTTHWQLGAIIDNQTANCRDCVIAEFGMEVFTNESSDGGGEASKRRMVFTQTKLTVDPRINKVTTWTQPADLPVIPMEGCIETLFIRETDVGVVRRKIHNEVKQGMLIIFTAKDLSRLNDEGIYRALQRRNVSVGFFADARFSSQIRDRLIFHRTPFFDNLVRLPTIPDTHDNPDRIYFSFKFIFSPIDNETSLPSSLVAMLPPRKINLADLVVFSPDVKTVLHRCLKKTEVVLSHQFGPASQVPVVPFVTRPEIDASNGSSRLSFFDHYGTHIDVPSHFGGDVNITRLPEILEQPLHCPKIDVSYGKEENFSITADHLMEWEKQFGTIPSRSLVLLVTGFGADRWNHTGPNKYQYGYPGLSVGGAKFLVEERKVAGIAIDSLLIDDFGHIANLSYPTHAYLADAGVASIENIGSAALADFPSKGGVCLLAYIRVQNGSGGPAALFGLKRGRMSGPL
jgi:kynurenine formamidase